jgi:hypothetical protein
VSSTTTTAPSTTTAGTTTAVLSPGPAKSPPGPFRPPKVPRPRASLKQGPSELPFTGAATPSTLLLGCGLLALGLLLMVFGRARRPAVHLVAAPRAPSSRGKERKPGDPAARAARGLGYRVFVPGRGAFSSVADAEQPVLDRRWARAGCPRLGAPGRRRSSK